MTIIASYGGSGDNTYVNLTDANSFITTSIIDHQSWTDVTSQIKSAALLEAAKDIDGRQYIGRRKYYDQVLEFPRDLNSGFQWSQSDFTSTSTFDTLQSRMREDVKQATCYQALSLLRTGGRNQHAENQAAGLESVRRKTGPIEDYYVYRGAGGVQSIDAKAMKILARWMVGKRAIRG